jgi:predicted nucleotidyltransferase
MGAMALDPAKSGGQLAVPDDDPTLAEITRRLVETYQPQRIYLFGSRARGTAGADSDYDLLVVVPDDAPPALRRSTRAYEVLWGLSTSGDILVWTHAAFSERLHLRASLPSTVEREGRLLYSR